MYWCIGRIYNICRNPQSTSSHVQYYYDDAMFKSVIVDNKYGLMICVTIELDIVILVCTELRQK